MKRLLLLLLLVFIALAGCVTKPRDRFVFLEGTVVDQTTGLVWMKNANLPGKPLPWRADDNVYAFIQELNKSVRYGYSDWRVPNRDELGDLVDYAKNFGGYKSEKMDSWPFQVLRRIGFEEVRDYAYWTATRVSDSEMVIVDLASGVVEPRKENKTYYLWPVRGTFKR